MPVLPGTKFVTLAGPWQTIFMGKITRLPGPSGATCDVSGWRGRPARCWNSGPIKIQSFSLQRWRPRPHRHHPMGRISSRARDLSLDRRRDVGSRQSRCLLPPFRGKPALGLYSRLGRLLGQGCSGWTRPIHARRWHRAARRHRISRPDYACPIDAPSWLLTGPTVQLFNRDIGPGPWASGAKGSLRSIFLSSRCRRRVEQTLRSEWVFSASMRCSSGFGCGAHYGACST